MLLQYWKKKLIDLCKFSHTYAQAETIDCKILIICHNFIIYGSKVH
jgi:hypothetical protein